MVEKALPEIKMYGYWRSSAAWRVRLMFAHKGIKYEYIPTNLIKGEQATEEYTKLNPSKVKINNLLMVVVGTSISFDGGRPTICFV